jgi:hypothetical protein
MADTPSPPNPATGMFWFFIITTIYFVIKYNTKDTSQSNIYLGIYLSLLIIGEYIINLSLTDSMCGSRQWSTVLFVTLIPWIIIFGILNICLSLFPGWLIPFSNTFGYGIARLSGVNGILDNILKSNMKLAKTENKEIAEALEHIYSDKSLLINEITPENFDRIWDNLEPFFKDGAVNFKDKLKDVIRLKDIVAEYIWYLLTGGLVTSVGYNYIVSAGCSQSLQNMKARSKDYDAKSKTEFNDSQTTEKRVYTMGE